jgi:hypothetical protein
MKHHSQVFIALFVLILLINIYPLQEDRLQEDSLYEGYTNTQTQVSNIYSDNSDNSYNSVTSYNDRKWLSSDYGGSSTEFKFSDKFNSKFKNPNINDISVNKPDFKLYDYYWPISDIN